MCHIKYSELPLKEGEVLEANNHKYVETADDVIEMKYCPHCGEWHLLTDFRSSSTTKDGLQSWCRACQDDYARQRTAMKKAIPQSDEETIAPLEQEQPVEADCFDKAMDLLTSLRLRDEERQQEMERLKKEVESFKDRHVDLESLSDREIETVLKSNNIAPRLLFEAIARQDGRYTFYAIDNFTGLTSAIRLSKQ